MLPEDDIFLTTLSLFCQIPSVSSENRLFPVLPAVNTPDFADTVTAILCPLTYAGKNERKILLAAPANITYRI